MRPITAFVAYIAYVSVFVVLALLVGPEPTVIGIPLNTLILSLGLLLTPVPTWLLANTIRTEEQLA